MSSRRRWVFVVLLPALARSTFVLLESKQECFLIEEPHDTEMTVKYEIPSLEKVSGSEEAHMLAVKLTLADRRHTDIVYSKTIADHKGEVELATSSDAVHHLCLRKVADSPKPLRVDFEINVGLSDRYYDELAAEQKMDKLQLQVVKLNDELAEILAEADFMKEKEVKFHVKAERVNLAALWWPIMQLFILLFTALFSVKNLKNYFSNKNLY